MTRITRQQAIARLFEIDNERSGLRQNERDLKTKRNALNEMPVLDSNFLENNLKITLPRGLDPKNIGRLAGAMWDFYFPLDFDFGDDATFNSTTRQARSVQVTQEAGFLLCAIGRSFDSLDRQSFGAPIGVTIRDLQSTRQFNDKPIPLQFLGDRGEPTRLATPLLVRPNANIEIELISLLSEGESIENEGSTKQEIVLYGLRIRDFNDPKVLTSLFL